MGLNFDKFPQLLEAKIHEFDKIPMEPMTGMSLR